MDEIIDKLLYMQGLTISRTIVELYSSLDFEHLDNNNDEIFQAIEQLRAMEKENYDKLSPEEIDEYLSRIILLNGLEQEIIGFKRYRFNLFNRQVNSFVNKLILVDGCYTLADFVQSSLVINSLCKVYERINWMKNSDDLSDREQAIELEKCFNRIKANRLTRFFFSEEYALKFRFDFEKIKPIDFNTLPVYIRMILEATDDIYLICAKSAISTLLHYDKLPNSNENTIDSLYFMFDLEFALSKLGIDSLRNIISFCNNILVNSLIESSHIENIKRLINKRKEELGI